MAGINRRSALPSRGWSHYSSEPQPNDGCFTWSAQQLARMDSNFCTRVATAFRAGSESVQAATATYNLLAHRRAR
jgi:hypothetical protein